MRIQEDDLAGPEIATLLQQHLDQVRQISPPGSVYALDLEALRSPKITFWSAWDGGDLLGCGALKDLGDAHAEIKSMRTVEQARGRGVASRMLEHILGEAKRRGFARVSLETGVQSEFEPARRLYARYGFENCGPFGSYTLDPNSVYMTLEIGTD